MMMVIKALTIMMMMRMIMTMIIMIKIIMSMKMKYMAKKDKHSLMQHTVIKIDKYHCDVEICCVIDTMLKCSAFVDS